jgi:ketosteroid isomerase-like protein
MSQMPPAPEGPPAEHASVQRIRDLFAAFRAGDVAAIERAIAPDAVWHFPGRRGRLAGSHRGRDAIFAFLVDVQAATGGTFTLELIDVLANERHAAVFFRGHATRNGKTLDNPTCLRVRLRDEQVCEVWEFVWDLEHVDDFWS